MKKYDLNKKGKINIIIFTKEQQELLRKTKPIFEEEYGEFVEISHKEQNELLGHIDNYDWSYFLYVDCDIKGFKIKSYDGVTITKSNDFEYEDIIKINTGDLLKDEKIALSALYLTEGDVDVSYSSTYDDCFEILKYQKEKNKVINLKKRKDNHE